MASSSSYMGPPPVDDFDSLIDFTGGVDANYAPEESTPFAGPSHDYSTFRQQTGFPSGSMSNTLTYNDVNMDANDFMSQPDFNTAMAADAGSLEMDFERTPRGDSTLYSQDDFVDPTAVYEPQPPPVRMWPGAHSKQAAALAKQNQHISRITQQQQQQQQQQPQQQQQAHTAHSSASSITSAPSASSSSKGKQRAMSTHGHMIDPTADRKISDILNSMRNKSAMSPVDEDDDDSHSGRGRRGDDEDLDDDERLLASEEGKKLTSKERRQLRNKVSARAFRSRRKEYISQLEGDLANKASEANDLRLMNRKLLEENNQLKNLTRTVLGHPAFHNFLDDMSRNPTFVPPPAEMIAPVPSSSSAAAAEPSRQGSSQARQPEIKMEQEQQQQHMMQQQQLQQQYEMQFRAQPEDVQVNMVQVPQGSLDMSMLNLGGTNHWAGQQQPGFNFQQPSVYAVFDVPAGPSREEVARAARLARQRPSAYTNATAALPPSTTSRHDRHALAAVDSHTLDSADDCLRQINHLLDTLQPPSRSSLAAMS